MSIILRRKRRAREEAGRRKREEGAREAAEAVSAKTAEAQRIAEAQRCEAVAAAAKKTPKVSKKKDD